MGILTTRFRIYGTIQGGGAASVLASKASWHIFPRISCKTKHMPAAARYIAFMWLFTIGCNKPWVPHITPIYLGIPWCSNSEKILQFVTVIGLNSSVDPNMRNPWFIIFNLPFVFLSFNQFWNKYANMKCMKNHTDKNYMIAF